MNFIEKSIKIALQVSENKLDGNGYPQILHSLHIGLMGKTDEEKATGFLHDVMQDSVMAENDLIAEEIPAGVARAVAILNKMPEDTFLDYSRKVISSGNPIALRVLQNKLTYLIDNHLSADADLALAFDEVDGAIKLQSGVKLYQSETKDNIDYAVFACGCFWGTQHQYNREKGVIRTFVGYTGGNEKCPSYEQVRDHGTNHVEAVLVEYDTTQTDFTQLCKVFFEIHDPAQTDGVGPDIGPQYRSCLFYKNDKEKTQAEAVANLLREKGDEVNTLFLPLSDFWIAEELHQDYYEKTGGSPYCHLRRKKFL